MPKCFAEQEILSESWEVSDEGLCFNSQSRQQSAEIYLYSLINDFFYFLFFSQK